MSFAANYLEQLLVFENYFLSLHPSFALVAKLVDAPDLGSGVAIRVGSSPIRRTIKSFEDFLEEILILFLRTKAQKKVLQNIKSFFTKNL